jgi:L-methionine (R)-S-oxide reductase
MNETLQINPGLSREEKYASLLPQLSALIHGERDEIANLANVAAALKQTFDFWWVGFYIVKHGELVLGPFQGPVACTRIAFGKGVCGKCWEEEKTIIVPDVSKFEGHIACSAESRSEIVLPIIKNGKVHAVLDVDSEHLDHFGETDNNYLSQLVLLLENML